jgi:hypothetical protein
MYILAFVIEASEDNCLPVVRVHIFLADWGTFEKFVNLIGTSITRNCAVMSHVRLGNGTVFFPGPSGLN